MTVIDIRPERLLREVRDHGDFDVAMKNAGMTEQETNQLLANSPKFSISVRECIYEYHEEKILAKYAEAKKAVVDASASLLKSLDDAIAAAIKEIRSGTSG